MASDNNWIEETVRDFIHSPIWTAPINTFIEACCLTFDYDDEDDNNAESDLAQKTAAEQKRIHRQYQRLADSLIHGLGVDLGLDQAELNRVCQLPDPFNGSMLTDESYEQLYAARDFDLFGGMMKRKNLILQLQALVSLQLQWGLLKRSDTGDDWILGLLMQATSSSTRRPSNDPPPELVHVPTRKQAPQQIVQQVKDDDDDDDDDDVVATPQRDPPPVSSRRTQPKVEPKKPSKEEYSLPNLRHKGASDLDAEWHRDLQRQDSRTESPERASTAPRSIETIPEKVLRQKLRDLTERTAASVDDETASAMQARKKFLQDQREKIVNEKRAERARELEQQQNASARPQSAAHAARKAMSTADENKREQKEPEVPNEELNRRRAMMAKLKREVVDKR